MLGPAIFSLLKPLKKVAERGFEVEMRSGKIFDYVLMILSDCGDISEGMHVYEIWLEARTHQPCFISHSTHEDKVRGTRNQSRVVAETIEPK